MADVRGCGKALRLAASAASQAEREGFRGIGVVPVEGHPELVVRVEKIGGVWAAGVERGDLGGEIEALPPSVLAEAGLEYCGMLDDRGPHDTGGFRTGCAWPVG